MTSTRNASSGSGSGSGCFSGIVHRLLCNGSPQTHPSDHITEPNITNFDHAKIEVKTEAKVQPPASPTPGVVARLMGLESLPEPNWTPKSRNSDSVTRSRSVNFMEYLLEFDLTQGQSQQHRRVRTSASFREVPTLFNQENQDFFVMYLNNEDETKGVGSKLRKSELGFGESKQKRPERNKNEEKKRERVVLKKENQEKNNKKISKFKDEPRRVSHKHISKVGNGKYSGAKVSGFKVDVNRKSGATLKAKSPVVKPINQKEVSLEVKCSKRKIQHAIKEVEPIDCSSDNSSPVSVLDVNDFDIYDATPSSVQKEDTRSMDLNFKKKPSPKTTKFDYPTSHSTAIFNSDDVELRAIKKTDYESVDTKETQYYRELVTKLLRLTEEDIKQSNWISKEVFKFDDFEEICFEFGQQILDLMLQQVVDELVGLHLHENF